MAVHAFHDAARGHHPTDATTAVRDVNSFLWSISVFVRFDNRAQLCLYEENLNR